MTRSGIAWDQLVSIDREENMQSLQFKVLVTDALEALKRNCADHANELVKARGVWRCEMREALRALTDEVHEKGVNASWREVNDLNGRRPVDNMKEYDKHIGVLEAALRAGQVDVVMSADEYDMLFNDNWHWRLASKVTNSLYLT